MNLTKATFKRKPNISAKTIAKMEKNGEVYMNVMLSICRALHYDIGDVIKIVELE